MKFKSIICLLAAFFALNLNIDAAKRAKPKAIQKKEATKKTAPKVEAKKREIKREPTKKREQLKRAIAVHEQERPNQLNDITENAKSEIKRVYENSLSKIRPALDKIRAEIRTEGNLTSSVEDLLKHADEETRERLERALNSAYKSLDWGRVKVQSLVKQAKAEARREAARAKKEREAKKS